MGVETEPHIPTGVHSVEPIFLESDQTRIELVFDAGRVQYRLWFWRDPQWICFENNPSEIVTGAFFDLRPTHSEIDPTRDRAIIRGQSQYEALNGTGTPYDWNLEIRVSKQGWVDFDLELNLPVAGRFNQRSGHEPALLLNLGLVPPYDRGHSFWARTEVLGYSRFDHTPNNDFPALYHRDPLRRVRLLMFFDMGAMAWMGPETMGRFRDYRMGLHESGGLERGQHVGLYGVSHSGQTWPAGTSRIAYSIHLKDEPRQTNDREALEDLTSSLGARVKGTPDLEYGIGWAELAQGTAQELLDDACWSITPNGTWLRPYVNDQSPVWAAVGAWEGKTNENLGGTPYMLWFQETVLAALEFGARFTALAEHIQPARDRVRSSTLAYYASVPSVFHGYMSSNMSDDAVRGTWQYVHSITTYWWAGRTLGLEEAMRGAEREVHDGLLPLLERHAFMPPITHSRISLEKVGPAVGFSVLGLCADLFTRLAAHSIGEDRTRWLGLALRCIRTLARAPEYAVHQESNHLASAVLAISRMLGLDDAHRLELEGHAAYLSHQALRQFYWCEEATHVENHPLVRIRGLCTCCTPMGYSAFWENISQALGFASAYANLEPNVTLLRFLNVLREHAKGSIPAAVKDESFAHAFIPLEDLQLLEVSRDPGAGQEVYGAGHVVWAYALFEAFCALDQPNPAILVLCTNLLDVTESLETRRTFLIFNADARAHVMRGRFEIPGFNTHAWKVYAASDSVNVSTRGEQHFEFELQPDGWVKLEVKGGTV
jgi:hypothetical protein